MRIYFLSLKKGNKHLKRHLKAEYVVTSQLQAIVPQDSRT